MPCEDITRKRRSRAGYIRFINKIIKRDLQTIYDDYNDEHLLKLASFKNILEEKLNNVMKLSEEIQADLEEEDEFTADFEKYTDIEVSIRHDIAHLNQFIAEKQSKKSCSKKTEKSKSSHLKLPKFELKKYNGDPANWRSFIESFEAAIDSNPQLSDIEKMNYVEGEAESTIKGLKLHGDNYRTAKNMLEERFGDSQVLIFYTHGKIT